MLVDSKRLSTLMLINAGFAEHLTKNEVQDCCMEVFGTQTLPEEVLNDLSEITDTISEERFVETVKEELVKTLKKIKKLYVGKLQGGNNAEDQS